MRFGERFTEGGCAINKKNYCVCWLSGGGSSFISAYLARDTVNELIFIDIDDQTRDTLRFVNECADYLRLPLTILKSHYGSVKNVVRQFRYINGVAGAKCTDVLKRRPRKEWEREHSEYALTYIWGFDKRETARAKRIVETNSDQTHLFPLIDNLVNKKRAHGVLSKIGIKRPDMYEMGYPNQNCKGCVKGGMGYWNKIRVDFPDVFESRAKLEREIGATCLKDKNGKVWLDELDPLRGNFKMEILPDCGIARELRYGI